MDALDELDRLEATATALGGQSPSGSEVSRTPREKLRRGRSMLELALVSTGSDGVPEDGADDEESKPCVGCHRLCGSVSSLMTRGEIVDWVYKDGRGQWCCLCHNVWRLCYKATVSLVFLAHGISTDKKTAVDWMQTLIAYCMIRRETDQRISAHMVQERRKNIEWLLRSMGLPLEPSVVVPWVALTAAERESADPQLLTSVHMGAGDYCLGLFVPIATRNNPPRLSRPVDEVTGDCAFHIYNTLLSSATETEHLELGSRPKPLSARAMLPLTDAPDSEEAVSVLGVRLNNAISACKLLLLNFCSDAWADNVKESSFTAPLGKLAVIGDEASQTLQSKVADKAAAWKGLMLEAKTFLRKFREYRKKWSHERLMECHPCLPKFVSEWATLMEDELAASLRVLHLKLNFFMCAGGDWEKCSIKRALGEFTPEVVKSLFPHRALGGAEGEMVDFDVWLRGPLFHAMDLQVAGMTLDTAQESVKTFHSDLQESADILGKLALTELRADLEAVLHVIAPFLQIHTPAQQVRSALKQLNETRNKKALQLFDHVVGELVRSAADMVVQRSVKDTAGDERFQAAQDAIKSQHLPFWTPKATGDIVCENWSAVWGGMVFDALQEAFGNVLEALSVWSSIHAEEHGASLDKWADEVLAMVRSVDAAITIYLSQNMREGIELLNLICSVVDDMPVVNFVWDDQVRRCLQTMGDQTVATAEFEKIERSWMTGFKGLLRCCRSLKAKLVERFPSTRCSWDALESGVQAAVKNQELRCNMVRLFALTADFGRTPRAGPGVELVDDWLALRNVGGGQAPHLLDSMSNVAALIKSLGGSDHVLSFHMQDFSADTPYASDETMEPWTGPDGCGVATALVRGAYAQKVHAALQEQVGQVLTTFTQTLSLNAISPVPKQDDMGDEDGSSVHDRVLAIIRFNLKEDEVVRLVARTLDDNDSGLPVNCLLEVLCKLVTTVGLPTLPLGELVARPNTPPLEAGTDLVLHAVVKYERVSALAHYLVFLATRMRDAGPRKKSQAEPVIHPHICKAIRRVHELVAAPEDEGNPELEEAFCNFGKSWAMGQAEVSAFTWQARAWLAEMGRTLFADATNNLEHFATHVMTCTPKYSSFLNDEQYIKALASKQLLNWPHRGDLPTLTMRLFILANDVKKLRDEWIGLGHTLPSLEASSGKVVEVLEGAKRAVATIAGVEAVQCLQGSSQLDAATKVLAKDALLPRALCEALKKVCAGGAGAAAATSAGKGTKRKAQSS